MANNIDDHRRRAIRRWLCACGRHWPCERYLDLAGREPSSGGSGISQTGWNIRLPVPR